MTENTASQDQTERMEEILDKYYEEAPNSETKDTSKPQEASEETRGATKMTRSTKEDTRSPFVEDHADELAPAEPPVAVPVANASSAAELLPKPLVADDYLEDDEEFLRGDDVVLQENLELGIFQQMENVVTWELDNFLDEEGKPRGKYSLRNDPPVFRVKSSDGNEATFLLTQELARSFEQTFETVHKAYFGVAPKTEKPTSFSERAQGLMDNAREHPTRTGLLIILVLFLIVSPMLF